jgi:hypothetical protein
MSDQPAVENSYGFSNHMEVSYASTIMSSAYANGPIDSQLSDDRLTTRDPTTSQPPLSPLLVICARSSSRVSEANNKEIYDA